MDPISLGLLNSDPGRPKWRPKDNKEDVGMSFSSAAEFFRRTGQKIFPRVSNTDEKLEKALAAQRTGGIYRKSKPHY
jgi:hypothetical protein